MQDLKARTKRFTVDSLKFGISLPHREDFAIVARQYMRSSSSVGANYRSACRGKSCWNLDLLSDVTHSFLVQHGNLFDRHSPLPYPLPEGEGRISPLPPGEVAQSAGEGETHSTQVWVSAHVLQWLYVTSVTNNEVQWLLREANELVAITVASKKTAKGKSND